jgi:hypothetical protein
MRSEREIMKRVEELQRDLIKNPEPAEPYLLDWRKTELRILYWVLGVE